MEREVKEDIEQEPKVQKLNNPIVINEYDKYDIIDFLESEYIDDWLNLIPNNLWIENKKIIENHVYKLMEPKIISYVIEKINLNLPKYVILNFEKINLNLLKFCFERYYDKFMKEIKKKNYNMTQIINKCIYRHDYEFNKYFYEIIYFELEPEHKVEEQNSSTILNLYGLLQNKYPNNIHQNNMFYNMLVKEINYCAEMDYDVLQYYNKKFKNYIKKYTIDKYDTTTIINKIYEKIKMKIKKLDELFEIADILNISKSDLKKIILISTNYIYSYKSIIYNVCMYGDIDLIVEVLNFLDNDIVQKKENIIKIMTSISMSNKKENVFLVYNILLYEKKCIFTKQIYSEIIQNIIYQGDKKFYEYDKIIFELINLGGEIKGYSMYTEYIEKLKIKQLNN